MSFWNGGQPKFKLDSPFQIPAAHFLASEDSRNISAGPVLNVVYIQDIKLFPPMDVLVLVLWSLGLSGYKPSVFWNLIVFLLKSSHVFRAKQKTNAVIDHFLFVC